MKLLAIILVIFMPGLAHAETVEGMARVVDGDTIEIKDQKIRLWGIDAPELAQRCTEDGAVYPCGLDASRVLAKQIGRKRVTCVRRDTEKMWTSADGWSCKGKPSLSANIPSTTSPMKITPEPQRRAYGQANSKTLLISGIKSAAAKDLPRTNMRHNSGKAEHAAPALALMTRTVPGIAAEGEALIYDWAAEPRRVFPGNSLGL